jgi:hypothetical protein
LRQRCRQILPDHHGQPNRHRLQRAWNIAVEIARRAIISATPKARKSPAATAGLFDFRKQPTRVFGKKMRSEYARAA